MRTWTLPVAVALAWAGTYLVSMLAATGGHLSMPLDDAYIFFQFAKRVVAGAPFTYQAGDGFSAGATSVLTVLVHTVGYLVGFRGGAMALFALLAGAAALAWSLVSAYRLGVRLAPGASWLPPALIAVSGPLVWGFLSGMDLPFFVALSLAFLADWPGPGERPRWRFLVWGALLGLTRPDALFWVLGAAVLGMTRPGRMRWLLPLAGAVFPFVLQTALTGSPQSASMDVKSVLSHPGFDVSAWLAGGASYLQMAIGGALGGGVVRDAAGIAANDGSAMGFFTTPLTLLFLLVGLVPGAYLEWRERRADLHLLVLLWIVLLLGAVAFTVPRTWHWHRYLMPIYPLVILGVAVGVDRLGRVIEAGWPALRDQGARPLGMALVLLALPGAVFFTVAYGRNCADIYFQHIELARNLNEGPGSPPRLVAIHDAGALAYFGEYRVLDLEGLVSPEFREASRLGGAGAWERMERIPPPDRPDLLVFYTSWFGGTFLQPHQQIGAQRVFRPSIAAGNPLGIYRCDWSLAGSGDLPTDPGMRARLERLRLIQRVDVADLDSEREAGYGFHILDGAYESLLRFQPGAEGATIADGGRLISGSERFTVEGLTPGRPLMLVGRSHAPFRIRVETNGRTSGTWYQEGGPAGSWFESAFPIPAEQVTGERLEVVLASDDPHHSAYGSFHYWIYQP